MAEGNMKESDFGIIIERTLKYWNTTTRAWAVLDVSDAEDIRLDVTRTEDGETVDQDSFTGEFSSDGSNGKVRYVTEEGDFVAGHYQGQFLVKKAGSYCYRTKRFHFTVDNAVNATNP